MCIRDRPTAEAVSKSEYTNSGLNANSFWYWWLADAYASYSCNVRSVDSSGTLGDYDACGGHGGVRPLCNLSSSILVSDTPDSDGAYTVSYTHLSRGQKLKTCPLCWEKNRGL